MKFTLRHPNKTIWQEVYSFFGFWRYTISRQAHDPKIGPTGMVTEYLVVYWQLFPFFFIRKIDLFQFYIREYDIHEELDRLHKRLDKKLMDERYALRA